MDEHSIDSNRSTDDGEQTEAAEVCKKIKILWSLVAVAPVRRDFS